MYEQEAEASSVQSADIHITIFPHLDEFMVIDVRDTSAPRVSQVKVTELLTPEYYEGLEGEFARLLREDGPRFLGLMLLPARVQGMLQERGMAALARMFGDTAAGEEKNRLSLFICAGNILNMKPQELGAAMAAFFQGKFPPSFVEACSRTFTGLLDKEKAQLYNKEREELRRAVLGQSEHFLTLWQSSPGTGFGPS